MDLVPDTHMKRIIVVFESLTLRGPFNGAGLETKIPAQEAWTVVSEDQRAWRPSVSASGPGVLWGPVVCVLSAGAKAIMMALSL